MRDQHQADGDTAQARLDQHELSELPLEARLRTIIDDYFTELEQVDPALAKITNTRECLLQRLYKALKGSPYEAQIQEKAA